MDQSTIYILDATTVNLISIIIEFMSGIQAKTGYDLV